MFFPNDRKPFALDWNGKNTLRRRHPENYFSVFADKTSACPLSDSHSPWFILGNSGFPTFFHEFWTLARPPTHPLLFCSLSSRRFISRYEHYHPLPVVVKSFIFHEFYVIAFFLSLQSLYSSSVFSLYTVFLAKPPAQLLKTNNIFYQSLLTAPSVIHLSAAPPFLITVLLLMTFLSFISAPTAIRPGHHRHGQPPGARDTPTIVNLWSCLTKT